MFSNTPHAQRVNRKTMSALLASTLEAVVDVDKFPKAVVDVFVMVLQVRDLQPRLCFSSCMCSPWEMLCLGLTARVCHACTPLVCCAG
jgi:hypothetical protein